MALEKNKVLTGPEASWMMSDADKRRHGLVHTVYTAAGGDVGGTVEKFQKVLMEQPAIDAVRAAVKSAEAESLGTVRFDTFVSVRAESHAAVAGSAASTSQLLPTTGGRQ
ncbi:hypothetical protein BCR44DRAFT_1431101 [Catenaria anguillulae PL171]|nr:hypothetical protein BCR44DRAFT_1431101 [Catenaria anguillulae PL171]